MQNRFETFTVLINRISRNIRKIKNREMAAYHLRCAHISCLYYLFSAPGLSAAELCERCEEDKATVSRAVEYLRENGFIVREAESARKYRSPILLTEKGTEAGRKIAGKIDRVLSDVDGALSAEELAAFYKSLAIISQCLEDVAQSMDDVL